MVVRKEKLLGVGNQINSSVSRDIEVSANSNSL
jgi:hypothetical protein